MSEVKPGRIFGLDVIRSFAVIMVLVAHTRFLNHFYPSLDILGKFGFLGVELFFVLSGYLIGGILIKTFEKNTDFLNLRIFWIRRWFRTMPNYYLFLLINFIIFYFALRLNVDKVNDYRVTNISLFFVFLQNFAWPRPFFFRESWSLCVEEWFYLLYPIIVLVTYKVFKLSVKKSLLVVTFLFLILPLISRIYFALNNNGFELLREIVINRLDAMMFGVLIAFIKFYHSEFLNRFSRAMFYVGLALLTVVICLIFIINITETFFGKTVFFNIVTVAFALLLPFSNNKHKSNFKWVNIGFEKISLWSYSLYLVNLPIEFVLKALRVKLHLTSLPMAFILILIFWVSNVLVAALIFNLFEKPIMSLREKFS